MSAEQYEQEVLRRAPESFSREAQRTISDVSALQEDARQPILDLVQRLTDEGYQVGIGETLRPQERQEYLFRQGRVDPGNIVTWTLTSDHTSGRAVDLQIEGSGGYERAWELAERVAKERAQRREVALRRLGRPAE